MNIYNCHNMVYNGGYSERKNMIRQCSICNRKLANRNKGNICPECRPPSLCTCGREKDYRARECRVCGSRTNMKKQWSIPDVKNKMLKALNKAGIDRRMRFKDLHENLGWRKKIDGRYFIRYWDDALEKFCWIYRYQWVWIKNNGKIPDGYVIHHKNGIPFDDKLDNLELLKNRDHKLLHIKINPPQRTTWKTFICQYCGKEFYTEIRKDRNQLHCSLKCRWADR